LYEIVNTAYVVIGTNKELKEFGLVAAGSSSLGLLVVLFLFVLLLVGVYYFGKNKGIKKGKSKK
jgi:hypothetical protein